MNRADPAALLERFDRELRRSPSFGSGDVRVERTERTTLCHGGDDDWCALLWSDLDDETADAEIARVLPRLRRLGGRHVEWKLYAHDRPADLGERLRAAGLVPGDEEAVMVAELGVLDLEPAPPDGVELRVVGTAAEVAAAVGLEERVFGGDHSHAARQLARGLEQEPPSMLGVLALAGAEPVSGGRVELPGASAFASLWGGGTLPEWRGRGIYRATVALRAGLARERGYRYLQVDALPPSRPILERLGFVRLTTTTPYTFSDGS